MARTLVTDADTAELVGWFNADRAELIEADRHWDGHNSLSKATGQQGLEQSLYRTASGRWVLNADSTRYNYGPDRYHYVSDEEARDWVVRCSDDATVLRFFPDTPEEVQFGRPEVGPQVVVRMPETLRDRIDVVAEASGQTRAAWIRQALQASLAASPA